MVESAGTYDSLPYHKELEKKIPLKLVEDKLALRILSLDKFLISYHYETCSATIR